MENASKALLIAAAVLIAVLLIAFGVGIFNQAKESGSADDAASTINTAITSGVTSLQTSLGVTTTP